MSETTNCEDCGRPFELHRKFLSGDTKSYCHIPDTRHWYIPAEPQAGAQVPSRFYFEDRDVAGYACFCIVDRVTKSVIFSRMIAFWPDGYVDDDGNADHPGNKRNREYIDELLELLNSHASAALDHIRNYATEAAKTPITREDMHDPLKAQTFYDEAKGFERLVLSEIGGGK